MKLTVQIKLLPTPEQVEQLLDTMRAFNLAASYAATSGFEAGVFSPPSIQRRCYYHIREQFGLSAQMAVRAIGKAAEAFKVNKEVCPEFKPLGAMTYDERILSWKCCGKVSILTLQGRIVVPYVCGEYQRGRLDRLKGQVDLVYRDGKFYLYATIDLPEDPELEVHEFLGIDLGIKNIATDSAGDKFTGEKIDRNRRRRQTARKQYQRRGTKNAKRRLKAISGRQRRFQTQENHRISKALVGKAKALQLGIAMEDLKGIRGRVEGTVSKRFRRRFGNWAFAQLRQFVEYKAKLAGVPVRIVDPKNTSRACSECGHCEKANRQSQESFRCLQCDYSANADFNAARNIASLGRCKPAPKATTTACSA